MNIVDMVLRVSNDPLEQENFANTLSVSITTKKDGMKWHTLYEFFDGSDLSFETCVTPSNTKHNPALSPPDIATLIRRHSRDILYSAHQASIRGEVVAGGYTLYTFADGSALKSGYGQHHLVPAITKENK